MICYETKEGDLCVDGRCPECGKFIKEDTIKITINPEGFKWQMDNAVKVTGECAKHGERKLNYYFD